jgi:hypothetical protein
MDTTTGAITANGGAEIKGVNGDGAVLSVRRYGLDPYVIIDTSPSSSSVLAYRKNNYNRWLLYADNASEGGASGGTNFRLDAYDNAGVGIANRLFVERATGNVGIGTTAPVAQLQAETGEYKMAVLGKATGTGTGVVGASSTGIGVYATSGSGMALYAAGNAGQDRDKGGLVKAMAYVNIDGAILRCYNAIANVSTGNCGFVIAWPNVDPYVYRIDFGFQVNDRFVSVTPRTALSVNIGATFRFDDTLPNTVTVRTYVTDVDFAPSGTPNPFMIIVY